MRLTRNQVCRKVPGVRIPPSPPLSPLKRKDPKSASLSKGKMKIALLSDIHGNSVALDAVLDDIEKQGGVDGYWVLGDLVALGPDPVGVLSRLTALREARFIRGNTDRYVSAGDRPFPSQVDVATDVSLLPRLVEIERTFTWTQGVLFSAGWLAWLAKLPLEIRSMLPDGSRFLGVHASPGLDDGEGFSPNSSEEAWARLSRGCDADVICAGHTHQPAERIVDGRSIINLGAVSLSLTPDKHACYVLLHAASTGHQFIRRSVAYDRGKVVQMLEECSHPGRKYIIGHLLG